MKSEDTASFLYGMAKRGRKYYLGLATITQDVDDFLKSPYGLPMITNSSIQILLKQSPTTIDNLQKTFNLSDEEKYLLLESDVGEGIFFAGLKHVAIKVIASYTEDQIITSDPSQVLALRRQRSEQPGGQGLTSTAVSATAPIAAPAEKIVAVNTATQPIAAPARPSISSQLNA